MKQIAIIPNLQKDEHLEYTKKIVEWMHEKAEIYMESAFQSTPLEFVTYLSEEALYQTADLILVLGGDGTILSASRKCAKFGKPILGVNLGRLGFLAELELDAFPDYVDKIANGDYRVEERMMLEAIVYREEKEIFRTSALNDIVITRASFSRLVDVSAFVGDEFLYGCPADGLVVSTPTGSTGYALSAGGPSVSPEMEAFLITPICPHTLQARSMVLPTNRMITLKVAADTDGEAAITADGQEGILLSNQDKIVISKYEYQTKLAKLNQMSFYELLHYKLSERK